MKMFGSILFLIFVSLISIALPRPIFASCSLDQGSRQYSAKYTLTDSGSAQCKAPNNKPNGPYTVWCDTQTEAYAADSVRQPLCGSSEERGKANSTCWNCGSTVKCDGLDFALGATDPFISQIHNPVNPGDTNTDQVWRIPNASVPSTFTYNGMPYSKPSGDLIVCGSNNLACGSSEECTNITYPDINNRGRSGAQQCQIYSFQGVTLPPPPTGSINPSPGAAQSSKGCINIGDYSTHFNELEQIAQLYKEKNINGWIYILALPEWMDSISAFITKYPQYNYMIRLHHPDAELSPSYANRWIESLKNYSGAIPTKIYLMPVNEPNNADPRRHVDPETVRIFVSALAQGLNNAGLLNTKYIITSPMIDPFEIADEGEGYLQDLCRDNFCSQFSALAVAPYGEQGASGLKHGDMTTIQKYFPGVPLIAAETGLVIPGQGAVYGSAHDQEMASYFHEIKPSWNSQNVIASCVFSYNPDTNGDQGWIYSATNVQNELFGLGQSIPPQTATTAQPPSTPSTISYESCTVTGSPKIPSKARIPNLISPDRQNSDPNKYTVTGVTFPVTKLIKGMIYLANNILKYPDMTGFARMLDGAMPALQPLEIQKGYQKIVHPLTITADAKVCVESEGGEVKARPITNDIKTEYVDLNKLVGASPFFASVLGLRKLSKYEQTNMAQLHPDLAPGGGSNDCQNPPQALNVREAAGLSGTAEFSEPKEKSAQYITPSQWVPQSVLDAINGLLCVIGGSANCNADFDPQYYLNLDLNTPYLNNVNDDVGANNRTGKHTGFVNSFAPKVLQDALGNDPGKIFHKVNQNLGSNSDPVDINLNFVNAEGIQTHERFLRCAITPQNKQYHDTCTFTDVRVPNTSDWAINGESAISSNFITPNTGSIQDAIVQAAQSEQIPQCVLEAVGYIEGAYNWQENDPRKQSCPRNVCSAAGPFQITTGVDGKGDASCSACDSSWVKTNGCPNTWGSRPGNPCSDYTYAAQVSAQILKGKVSYGSNGTLSLTASDPKSQKDAIILAGNGYYGGDAPVGRLGGCSYGEFVYQRCDPSYTCIAQIK